MEIPVGIEASSPSYLRNATSPSRAAGAYSDLFFERVQTMVSGQEPSYNT